MTLHDISRSFQSILSFPRPISQKLHKCKVTETIYESHKSFEMITLSMIFATFPSRWILIEYRRLHWSTPNWRIYPHRRIGMDYTGETRLPKVDGLYWPSLCGTGIPRRYPRPMATPSVQFPSRQTPSAWPNQSFSASLHSPHERLHLAAPLRQDQPPDYDLDSAHWTPLCLQPYLFAYLRFDLYRTWVGDYCRWTHRPKLP